MQRLARRQHSLLLPRCFLLLAYQRPLLLRGEEASASAASSLPAERACCGALAVSCAAEPAPVPLIRQRPRPFLPRRRLCSCAAKPCPLCQSWRICRHSRLARFCGSYYWATVAGRLWAKLLARLRVSDAVGLANVRWQLALAPAMRFPRRSGTFLTHLKLFSLPQAGQTSSMP